MKTNYWKESTYWKLYLAAVAIVIILTIVIWKQQLIKGLQMYYLYSS